MASKALPPEFQPSRANEIYTKIPPKFSIQTKGLTRTRQAMDKSAYTSENVIGKCSVLMANNVCCTNLFLLMT